MNGKIVRLLITTDGDPKTLYLLNSDGIQENSENTNDCDNTEQVLENFHKSTNVKNKYRTDMHILIVDIFIEELRTSKIYRDSFFNKLSKIGVFKKSNSADLVIGCEIAGSYIIDYKWGMMLWREIHLEVERDSAASWLSTLGGAYSSLGDYSSKFAETALKISLQQIRLASSAGDQDLVARGWLFLALAFSQLGYGKLARSFLNKAFLHKSFDPRHMNMCYGVNAKLKYDSKMRRIRRKNGGNTRSDLSTILKSLKL